MLITPAEESEFGQPQIELFPGETVYITGLGGGRYVHVTCDQQGVVKSATIEVTPPVSRGEIDVTRLRRFVIWIEITTVLLWRRVLQLFGRV